jgi:hypothetical protein
MLHPKFEERLTEKIINALVQFSGFDDLWFGLEDDIQNEIRDEIESLIKVELYNSRVRVIR